AYDDLTGLAQVNGGFLVTGITSPETGDLAEPVFDAHVAKLNAAGNIVYYRKYGGSKSDDCNAMVLASDGNAVLTGHTGSNDGDISGTNNGFNVWTFKIDVANNGNILWQNIFGMPNDTAAGFNLTATHDGGFVVVGAIAPNEGDPARTWDAYAGKVDANGNLLWTKRFGGNKFDGINSVVEENNHSILMAGSTKSNNGDVHGNHGGPEDAWLVNLDGCGLRISNPNPPAPETVVSCKCNIPGYGCFPTNWTCKMACASYCHNHRTANGENILTDNESYIDIYPNPVSNSATISFSLEQSEKVSVNIFDLTGRLVKTLVDATLPEGANQLKWNATDENGNNINTGIYFLRFETPYYSESKKISVTK
ncbi:MAG: T9SS type A sorting domain-containing protein, partial [Bacteroidota bacterium]